MLVQFITSHNKNITINQLCGKFLDVASCEKGPEIGIDSFHNQEVVEKDMGLEVPVLYFLLW
jgi:hypothetical protein